MAITYVLKVAVPADQSIQQYKEVLEKRLASLKPRRLNKFQVQTIVFQSTINQASIHQFLHSDYPVTCFSIIEPISSSSGSSTSSVPINDLKVLTGDIGLASIQRRVSELGILVERKPLQIECTGSAFKIGDFQIKIGAVTHNSSNRGLIIEISYSSASNNHDSYGFILEFIQNFFGWSNITDSMTNLVRRKPPHMSYTPEDTIIQYYEHFNNFRSFGTQQR
jgi:hypothetical protein